MSETFFSPLRFEKCALQKLIIETDPAAEPMEGHSPNYEVAFDLGHRRLGEQPRFVVGLQIAVKRPEPDAIQPFSRIEASVQGVFSLPADTPQEVVEALIPLNCLAMLYGVVRGIVAQNTGATAHGALWLPSVNFVALMQGDAEEDQPEAGPPPKKAPARKRPKAKKRK